MAVINVTAGSQAILTLGNTSPLAVPGVADGLVIPTMQDITVGASTGSVRYSVLNSGSSQAFTTVNENSITLNMLVDDDVFFGNSSLTANEVGIQGLLQTSINKTEVFFSVAFEGSDVGDYYLSGKGFLTGLTPTASIDAAVWLSPMEIIVNGEMTKVIAS